MTPDSLVRARERGTVLRHGPLVPALHVHPMPPASAPPSGFGRAAPDLLTLAVIAYLALPAFLFLAGWARPWAAALAGLAGVGAMARLPGRNGRWPLGRLASVGCLMAGLAWAMGTGAHHLLYSTADWQIRDAVLRDLALAPWPVGYADATGGLSLLRAPLGFFLPAGFGGRIVGLSAAEGLLWAWCGLGLGLVLALLAAFARVVDPLRPGRAFAVLASIFVVFHGADLLPNLWLDARAGAGALAAWGRGGEWWDRFFQYSGHVTALLWAPNHALPAWLAALLVLRHHRARSFPRMAAMPLGAAAFWSPIGAAGAALLTVAALAREGRWRRALAARGNWMAAGFALPLCLYLTAGSGAVPHGLVLAVHPPIEALGRWVLFLGVEVLPWAVPVLLLGRGDGLVRVAIGVLCLLPLYVFGPGNEMASRGGMAPLAVLAVAAGAALAAPVRKVRAAAAMLRVVAALAVAGAAMEASLLVTRPAWAASRACSVPQAAHQSVFDDSTDWSHYLVPWPETVLRPWMDRPGFVRLPPPDQAPRCWPRGGP